MVTFPNAKINLGLNVLRKRRDGYHDIDSCLYPIPWCDALEIVQADSLSFHPSGLVIPGDPNDNLCIKAFNLVSQEVKNLPPVAIYLHKAIPMGAGLGGGSSDGACMIKLLNEEFGLGLDEERMEYLASQLGSDCPFFIKNGPALATGTGTDLRPIELDLSGMHVGLIYPSVHVSTKAAYAGVSPAVPEVVIQEVLASPMNEWKDRLVNDFEASIFPNHPKLLQMKEKLYEMGAVYAAMSGSGSAMFGLFREEPDQGELDFSKPL
ncbi:MAG: 4-(cytidine 5'-diphospho)-2-C-methyl-D-erythritol kinase [Bacteroidota bacterium]